MGGYVAVYAIGESYYYYSYVGLLYYVGGYYSSVAEYSSAVPDGHDLIVLHPLGVCRCSEASYDSMSLAYEGESSVAAGVSGLGKMASVDVSTG